jgi:hypothetical protein
MEIKELSAWLFENGGPVIRYRVATELLPPNKSINVRKLRDEMMKSQVVKTWLKYMVPASFFTGMPEQKIRAFLEIHGSKPTCLENFLAKLIDLGLKKGIPELDGWAKHYLNWFEEKAEEDTPEHIYDAGMKYMAAVFLARAGYVHEPSVKAIIRKRINLVYDFVRKGDYNIYVSKKGYRIPKNFQKYSLINPELTRVSISRLPLIYDIIGLAAYLPEGGTKKERDKADTIINYVFNEEYQKLPWGYGVMTNDEGRFWGLGWSVHIPGYTDSLESHPARNALVLFMSLLANFKAARQHPWFKERLNHLEEFRTERGTYLFPKSYLNEKPQGYWVNGAHAGLGENRRKKPALELESTFWMMRIFKDIHRSE